MLEKENDTLKTTMMLYGEVEIHSYGPGKDDYEVIDISFPIIDKKMNKLENKLATFTNKESSDVKNLVAHLLQLDAIKDMGTEELGDYGNIPKEIHKEYWKKNPNEQTYIAGVGMNFFEDRDYMTGEMDTRVESKWIFLDTEKENIEELNDYDEER